VRRVHHPELPSHQGTPQPASAGRPGDMQHTHTFIHSCYACSRSSFQQHQPIPRSTHTHAAHTQQTSDCRNLYTQTAQGHMLTELVRPCSTPGKHTAQQAQQQARPRGTSAHVPAQACSRHSMQCLSLPARQCSAGNAGTLCSLSKRLMNSVKGSFGFSLTAMHSCAAVQHAAQNMHATCVSIALHQFLRAVGGSRARTLTFGGSGCVSACTLL
jgi:hypothetical protein